MLIYILMMLAMLFGALPTYPVLVGAPSWRIYRNHMAAVKAARQARSRNRALRERRARQVARKAAKRDPESRRARQVARQMDLKTQTRVAAVVSRRRALLATGRQLVSQFEAARSATTARTNANDQARMRRQDALSREWGRANAMKAQEQARIWSRPEPVVITVVVPTPTLRAQMVRNAEMYRRARQMDVRALEVRDTYVIPMQTRPAKPGRFRPTRTTEMVQTQEVANVA